MKNNHITYLLLLFIGLAVSCSQEKTSNVPELAIDLDDTKDAILYSQFAKSLDYIELNTNDSCIISGVRNIFLDYDT